jgi:hypothetical protein
MSNEVCSGRLGVSCSQIRKNSDASQYDGSEFSRIRLRLETNGTVFPNGLQRM